MAATPDARMPLAGRAAHFGMSPNIQEHAFQQQRIHPPCRLVRHVSEPAQEMKMAVAGMQSSHIPPATANAGYGDRDSSQVAQARAPALKPSTAPQRNGALALASHAPVHQVPQQQLPPQLHPCAPLPHDMSPAHPRSLLRRARSGSRLCCSSRGCGSTADLEEDLESPGSFYCSQCWDKIEAGASVGGTLRRSRLTALGRAIERVSVREQQGHEQDKGQDLAPRPLHAPHAQGHARTGETKVQPHTCHRPMQQQTRQQVQPMCSTPGCNVCDVRLLEEDIDNPGVFYCTSCWQAWEQSETSTTAPQGSEQGVLHPQSAGAPQQVPPTSSFPGASELGVGHEMAAHTAYVSNTGEGLATLDADGATTDAGAEANSNTGINHSKDHARFHLNGTHGSTQPATESSATAATSAQAQGLDYGHIAGQGLSPTIASARSPRPPPPMLLPQEVASSAPAMQPRQPQSPSPSPSQQSPRKLSRGPLSGQQAAAKSPANVYPPKPSAPVVLSVFHDLPHFTRSISEARRAVEILIETKASDERGLLLIKGTIKSAESAEGPNYAACTEQPRGGDVLLVSDLEGYVLSQLETCKKQALGGHFGMVRLDPSQGEVFDGRGGVDAVPQFLCNCGGALKVILNPSHAGDWYPVSDASSTRPLPPASRSAGGMGYFKMGDDMSKNGAAFLSIDGGNSYIRAATAYGDSDSRSVAPRGHDAGVSAHANENEHASGKLGASGASLNSPISSATSVTTGLTASSGSNAVLGAGTSLIARLEAGAFYALIQSGWKERHTALSALHHELELVAADGVPTDGEFASAVQWTSGECTRVVNETVDACADPNVKVCAIALNCVAVLARGLGDLFRAEARQMLPTIFKRLKERSRPLVFAARACLDALVHSHCVSFSQDIHRELCKAMDPKEMRSAAGRVNAGEWVLAWLQSHEIGEVPQDVLEQLAGIVINPVLQDSAPSAKKWATAVLSIVLSEPNCPPQLAAKLMQQASELSARAHNKFRDIMSGIKAGDSLAAGPRGAASNGTVKPQPPKTGQVKDITVTKLTPAAANAIDDGALGGQKFEIELLLHPRFRVEDGASVCALKQMSAKSINFLQTLESLATQLAVPKGKLSRWLLPFDSNTNINDQSARRPPSPRTQAHFREIDARVPAVQKEAMIKDATELRGFVRVKLADDNDLEQARKAMEMTQNFCKHLDAVAQQKGITPFELWQQL